MFTKKVIHLFTRKSKPTAVILEIDIQEFAGFTACGENCPHSSKEHHGCTLDIIDMSLRWSYGEPLDTIAHPINKYLYHRTELCECLERLYRKLFEGRNLDDKITDEMEKELIELFKRIDSGKLIDRYDQFVKSEI